MKTMTKTSIHYAPANFAHIYGASWVAHRALANRAFRSKKELIRTFVHTMDTASLSEKLSLLQMQPQLGELLKTLPTLKTHQFEAFMLFNTVYHIKFDFPFIVSVKHKTVNDLLTIIEQRLSNTPQEEFREALSQLHLIATNRLRESFHTEAAPVFR
ncbi:2-oxo-4-hydroxy-4-carboxy-5-ureidoimidazoline decarboxylase [Kurthia massiliensis]|uniref:2-oxo-4-hydroxy-4-carboxy-5-ureidoimidazoline decarboxylase n=1 Tax=Kurthia massiliensis TaxID=1033739 RepID=UPI000288B894|nr:2-oxo-4-hydroxy-4-carboxy-5-ureidoimidazoline decarboxylase [Kurthia massiliensis]